MIKKILLSTLITVVVFYAKAQTNQEVFKWAKRIDTDQKFVAVVRMIADVGGNTYTVANQNYDEVLFNLKTSISKVNTQGDTLWNAIFNISSTTENDYVRAYDLVTDNTGNVYIAGYFSGKVDFNPGTATSYLTSSRWTNGFHQVYSYDAFIVKLNASGNFVWAKKYAIGAATNNPNTEKFYSLTLDSTGNLYAAGEFNTNGLLHKINPSNGNIIWQKDMPGKISRIVLDKSNNIFAIGGFSGTKDFDPGEGIYNLTSSGKSDAYVMKMDADGNFIWANRLGGTDNDSANSLVTDNSGNVYITGYYIGAATYQSNGTDITLPYGNDRDGFIAKLNASDGQFSWVSSFRNQPASYADDIGYGIAIDLSENIYVVASANASMDKTYEPYFGGVTNFGQRYYGYRGTDIAIFKLNKTDGYFSSIYIIGGTKNDFARDIATDAENNIYVTGVFNDNARFTYGAQNSNPEDVDFDPSPDGVFYLSGDGAYMTAERFIMKMEPKDISLGAGTTKTKKLLIIYPNPTNGIVHFSETINAKAINGLGQIVADKKKVNFLNLNEYPKGMYFITIINDEGQVIQKNKILKK